jgi:CheY-like chemotaxis protein
MSNGGETVLLVEDDLDLRKVEELVLVSEGYRVVTACDGGEALAQLSRERPAVILLDMRMAGMNGAQFMKTFRLSHDHEIPVVVVTAAVNAARCATDVGAEDSLAKPFGIEDLVGIVARYVRHQPQHPER